MTALIIGGAVYGVISLVAWRHLAYRYASKEAMKSSLYRHDGQLVIEGDDIGEGIMVGLVQTIFWPILLLAWYFKQEPFLHKVKREN